MKRILLILLMFGCLLCPVLTMAADFKEHKVLIVYYSNTGVTDLVAQKLQERTGADIFRIETVRTYPTQDPERTEDPKRELDSGVWPQLKQAPPDMSGYDLILVGGPVWWYTPSTPMRSFLSQADFAGKKVAPFCTHKGGIGDYFEYFSANAKNATLLKGLDLYYPAEPKGGDVDKKLDDWLSIISSALHK